MPWSNWTWMATGQTGTTASPRGVPCIDRGCPPGAGRQSARRADHPDTAALERKVAMLGADPNGGKVGILGHQRNTSGSISNKTLHRHFVIDPRHHHLTMLGVRGPVHRDQVAVEDAG